MQVIMLYASVGCSKGMKSCNTRHITKFLFSRRVLMPLSLSLMLCKLKLFFNGLMLLQFVNIPAKFGFLDNDFSQGFLSHSSSGLKEIVLFTCCVSIIFLGWGQGPFGLRINILFYFLLELTLVLKFFRCDPSHIKISANIKYWLIGAREI